jgi:hypothetical protein
MVGGWPSASSSTGIARLLVSWYRCSRDRTCWLAVKACWLICVTAWPVKTEPARR